MFKRYLWSALDRIFFSIALYLSLTLSSVLSCLCLLKMFVCGFLSFDKSFYPLWKIFDVSARAPLFVYCFVVSVCVRLSLTYIFYFIFCFAGLYFVQLDIYYSDLSFIFYMTCMLIVWQWISLSSFVYFSRNNRGKKNQMYNDEKRTLNMNKHGHYGETTGKQNK